MKFDRGNNSWRATQKPKFTEIKTTSKGKNNSNKGYWAKRLKLVTLIVKTDVSE